MSDAPETEVLVIGAGPVGLYAVFQLGLLGISCTLIDAHPHPGGQPAILYPDKPIYDLPGILSCTGAELTQRLWRQIQPFTPRLIGGQVVLSCQPLAGGRWQLQTQTTAAGGASAPAHTLSASAIVLAAGVGAFAPKRLPLPELDRWEGSHVQHQPSASQWPTHGAIVIVGGGPDAVQAALTLAERSGLAAPPVLLHRRAQWEADPGQLRALHAHAAQGRLQLLAGQITHVHSGDGGLHALTITPPEGPPLTLPADHLLVFLGLTPRLGPLADWGLVLQRKLLPIDPADCRTNLPGIYAVGDVVTYPGKKKLLVSGFHECIQAAYAIASRLRPDHPPLLEYTSSSTKLQRRLGVLGDASGPAASALAATQGPEPTRHPAPKATLNKC